MIYGDLLGNRARLTPNKLGLVDVATGLRFRYCELNERANRLANALVALGVAKGDRVAILAQNGVEYVDAYFAAGKIGAILTPLNWRLAVGELAFILADCSPSVLIAGPEFSDILCDLLAGSSIRYTLTLGGEQEIPGAGGTIPYRRLLEETSPDPVQTDVAPDDPYAIFYTSGTTGHPKGAVLPHRQVIWNCINTVVGWGLTPDDIAPILTPMFHTGGLNIFLTPLVHIGGTTVVTRAFEPDLAFDVIEREHCTVILGVPTIFKTMLDSPRFAGADFSRVRFFISGGAPCPSGLMDAWRRKAVVFKQGYGLTEVGVNCFAMTGEESIIKPGSVGKPMFHSEMRIVDDQDCDLLSGQDGELCIKGPHVCLGYWNNPQATAEALRDGWFHTGDMARVDTDGFYYIVGRKKDMIISGGENIYAAEVEAVLVQHPAVADAALIGVADAKWGEVGRAIVVPQAGQSPSAGDIVEFCRHKLARYKVPKTIVFTPSLPRSPYGKVIKAELRRQFGETEEQTHGG
jgi:fatty-acyl-CoA synthase